jgi:hypothetical protein
MWTCSAQRELLEEIAAAAPGLARQRSRVEAHALMLSAFGPLEDPSDPQSRARVAAALDTLLEDRRVQRQG